MALKGVIFGIDNVLATSSGSGTNQLPEIKKLLDFLKLKGVQPVVLSNRNWTANNGTQTLQSIYDQFVYQFPWFISSIDSTVPRKPGADAVAYVLKKMNWSTSEVVYIGNDDSDMQSAVNGKVLFLNAQWYDASQTYGLKFQTPKEVARFIDVFALRNYFWHYSVQGQECEFYSLGTYGKLEPKYAGITEDAFQAAKYGRGHPDFWIKYLLSTVYFSGLKFNYIATFPSSKKGIAPPSSMQQTVVEFTKCFRTTYIPDLIVRHQDCIKSAYARRAGQTLDHENQLNTINITKFPERKPGLLYKANPLVSGKTVLVIDDFCTQGYAQEAARLFIRQTGAKAIGLTLLKTINRGYREISNCNQLRFDPFQANTFQNVSFTEHSYAGSIIDPTEAEIQSKLSRYDTWDWP